MAHSFAEKVGGLIGKDGSVMVNVMVKEIRGSGDGSVRLVSLSG